MLRGIGPISALVQCYVGIACRGNGWTGSQNPVVVHHDHGATTSSPRELRSPLLSMLKRPRVASPSLILPTTPLLPSTCNIPRNSKRRRILQPTFECSCPRMGLDGKSPNKDLDTKSVRTYAGAWGKRKREDATLSCRDVKLRRTMPNPSL